jgi:hypothetical protein
MNQGGALRATCHPPSCNATQQIEATRRLDGDVSDLLFTFHTPCDSVASNSSTATPASGKLAILLSKEVKHRSLDQAG